MFWVLKSTAKEEWSRKFGQKTRDIKQHIQQQPLSSGGHKYIGVRDHLGYISGFQDAPVGAVSAATALLKNLEKWN